MSQLIFPSALATDDSGIHSILFNINTLEAADGATSNARVIENPDSEPSAMNELYRNPYGNNPVLYDAKSSHLSKSVNESGSLLAQYQRTEKSIVLQMPDDIGSTYGIEWKHSEFGGSARTANLMSHGWDGLRDGASNIAGSVLSSTKDVTGIDGWKAQGSPGESFSKAGGLVTDSLMSSIGEMGAAGVQKVSGVNLMDILERTRGKIINPLIETIFKGVTNRTFTFKFVFFPRNQQESQAVLDIITAFKRHSHPELIHGAKPFFNYPDTFDITFMLDTGNPNPWLFRMSTCALTNIETNETPQSKWISHKGGDPVVRELSITFTEMEQLHKERFSETGSF